MSKQQLITSHYSRSQTREFHITFNAYVLFSVEDILVIETGVSHEATITSAATTAIGE